MRVDLLHIQTSDGLRLAESQRGATQECACRLGVGVACGPYGVDGNVYQLGGFDRLARVERRHAS